jgi:hypothetical protein
MSELLISVTFLYHVNATSYLSINCNFGLKLSHIERFTQEPKQISLNATVVGDLSVRSGI